MAWNKQSIIQILENPQGRTDVKGKWCDNRFLIWKMLQALYERQTAYEQEHKLTVEENGVGFNGYDSGFLSEVAETSKRFKNLTQPQANAVARRLRKYAGQLERIALENIQLKLMLCPCCKKSGHSQDKCPEYKRAVFGREPAQMNLGPEYPD